MLTLEEETKADIASMVDRCQSCQDKEFCLECREDIEFLQDKHDFDVTDYIDLEVPMDLREDSESCDVCGEQVLREETRVRILGLYRRRVCDSCNEEYSKTRQRNMAEDLDARTCGFCDTEFSTPMHKQKHQRNECESMPRTRTAEEDS